MDLLGSILGSMEKPPAIGGEERRRAKEQKNRIAKIQEKEKQHLNAFRTKMQARINEFIKDSAKEKYKFEAMEKVYRAIVHEVADVAGLTTFSFGHDEVDRHVMIWKKEFAPSDEELLAYRKGEEWDPEKAKEQARLKEEQRLEDEKRKEQPPEVLPASNYKDKYEHIIGKASAKDAAKITTANRAYGFVSSANKRDRRTIEEVMAESRARKKQRPEGTADVSDVTDDLEDSETS